MTNRKILELMGFRYYGRNTYGNIQTFIDIKKQKSTWKITNISKIKNKVLLSYITEAQGDQIEFKSLTRVVEYLLSISKNIWSYR